MRWPYDDKRWWIDEIYHATHTNVMTPMIDYDRPQGQLPSAEELSEFYTASCRKIADGSLEPYQAANLLFLAKSLKKWRIASSEHAQTRRNEAYDGFMRRNAEAGLEEFPDDVIYVMKGLLQDWLPRVTPEDARLGERLVTGRFGPGAVAEKWTHVQRLERLDRWVTQSAHWPDVPDLTVRDMNHDLARLCAVPKEETRDRLITVEPAYNSFVQQYVRQLLLVSIHSGPLRGTCMDLGYTDGQALQRRLALQASRNGANATIDLKDASDRISWGFVQRVFPTWVVDWLDVSRTPYVEDPRDGRRHQLRIFAGMGNATTFVVETLFFSAYVKAMARIYRVPGRVSVFGDDVICASPTARLLMDRQYYCFTVNLSKSFAGVDALRESCGIFAYKGIDITAPRVDGYTDTRTGRLGLCELHGRLRSLPWAYGFWLSLAIAKTHLLVNWPARVEGYPHIVDERVDFDAEPRYRYNRSLQAKQAFVPVWQVIQRSFLASDPDAKRWNLPRATVWLNGWLCGMVQGRPEPVTGVRVGGASVFPFPTGLGRWRHQWARVIPEST